MGLCPTSCGLPTGSSSVTAGLLHPCQGLKTASKQGEVTVTSGLTTTSTFSTTNTLLQPDFWQEKQVPCLRFPFKDFSQPSFNSASYSIPQRKEVFSLPPSCYHSNFLDGCLFLSHMGMEEQKVLEEQKCTKVALAAPGLPSHAAVCPFPSPSVSCLAIKAKNTGESTSQ